MVKFYTTTYTYDYSLPAVSLAYFLRYPNPYSTHVLSTDVIERNYDAATQRLTTVRLHLKRSKLPAAVLKLLPKSLMGGGGAGDDSQAYILERSEIDITKGVMKTESRNLEWTGVLSVVESQEYRRESGDDASCGSSSDGRKSVWDLVKRGDGEEGAKDRTFVTTTVALRSHIGENLRRRRARMAAASGTGEESAPKMGFFKSWTTGSIQRSIELIGLRRAEGAQPKAKQGMQCVLERLRQGGLVGVLEGMRKDRELMFAPGGSMSGEKQAEISISED